MLPWYETAIKWKLQVFCTKTFCSWKVWFEKLWSWKILCWSFELGKLEAIFKENFRWFLSNFVQTPELHIFRRTIFQLLDFSNFAYELRRWRIGYVFQFDWGTPTQHFAYARILDHDDFKLFKEKLRFKGVIQNCMNAQCSRRIQILRPYEKFLTFAVWADTQNQSAWRKIDKQSTFSIIQSDLIELKFFL